MEPIHIDVDLASLKAKSALITGGASGIGLATARAWAAAGVYVTIADIQPVEAGAKLAAELSSAGGHVNYAWCDVTDWDSQIAAFKSAITFPPSQTLDIVATFAGTAFAPQNEVDQVLAAGEPSLDINPKRPDTRNIEINLTGVYYSSWLALYYFRLKPKATTANHADAVTNGDQDGTDSTVTSSPNGIPNNNTDSTVPSPSGPLPTKSLILVASIGAYMDSPKASTYPASKFGVRGLFRSTRARTLDIGVRCNLLAPWFIDTPLIAPIKKAMASRGIDMAKMLSFASVESCVDAANLCAADSEIHGRALAIQPEGIFDLNDDLEHGWAGDQLRPIMRRRREAGFDA